MIEPGFYRISNEQYHEDEGVSKSTLHKILRSPLHAVTPQKETDALIDGSAVHSLVFEPERYEQEYIVKPEGMRFSTKEGKAWKADAELSGKQIITAAKYEHFKGMAEAVRAHLAQHEDPVVRPLLSEGEPELSGYWVDPHFGDVLCKLRMDWIQKTNRVIVDLKTCTDAREHAFTRDAYKFGYDMQAGWYTYGCTHITKVEHKEFYFIAVEKDPPYGVCVYKASEEFMQQGMKRCYRALTIYRDCLQSDLWPCYPPEVSELQLPGWVRKKEGYEGFWE